jgi:8-oxo-dGTP pyrophosphatase MutT (NUDIX family)
MALREAVLRWGYRVAHPLRALVWRLWRPRTHGVKVLACRLHEGTTRLAVLRNSYGNPRAWHLPGGGYRPQRESPVQAACRELREELGLALEAPRELGRFEVQAEGKRDTVVVVTGVVHRAAFTTSAEVAEAAWALADEIGTRFPVYASTGRALALWRADAAAAGVAPDAPSGPARGPGLAGLPDRR